MSTGVVQRLKRRFKMGGQNQGVIDGGSKTQKKSKQPPPPAEVPVEDPEVIDMGQKNVIQPETPQPSRLQQQKIRYHFNANEVHLHDDDSKIKVAISAPEFWTAWRRFKTGFSFDKEASFIDFGNKTVATFKMGVGEGGKIDFVVSLQKAHIPDNLDKIETFVNKSS